MKDLFQRTFHFGRDEKDTHPPSRLYKFYMFIPPIKRHVLGEPYEQRNFYAFSFLFWPHRCGFGSRVTFQRGQRFRAKLGVEVGVISFHLGLEKMS